MSRNPARQAISIAQKLLGCIFAYLALAPRVAFASEGSTDVTLRGVTAPPEIWSGPAGVLAQTGSGGGVWGRITVGAVLIAISLMLMIYLGRRRRHHA